MMAIWPQCIRGAGCRSDSDACAAVANRALLFALLGSSCLHTSTRAAAAQVEVPESPATAAAAAANAPGSGCPAGTTRMGTTAGGTAGGAAGAWTVCEATSLRNGSLQFINANGTAVDIEKSAEPLFGCNGADPVRNATAGCSMQTNDGYLAELGDAEDPAYSVMRGFLPPMVYDGGYNRMDPAHLPPNTRDPAASIADGHQNVHTWVGSRSSWTDVPFDSNGGDISYLGTPVMNQWTGKYHRSKAVFKNKLEPLLQREGLWGGWLPIVTYHFRVQPGGGTTNDCECSGKRQPCPGPSHAGHTFCPTDPTPGQCDTPCANSSAGHNNTNSSGAEAAWIEWTACPVADMKGNRAQDVYFRVLKVAADGSVLDARYFDTYAFRWADAVDGVPGMGQGPGSTTAARFYGAVLDQKVRQRSHLLTTFLSSHKTVGFRSSGTTHSGPTA
eukprot:SAG22_NODE_35_length_27276_cov_20.395849_2_plen_444_part_00